ncbi:MAG: tetratricopeptide repeat protein [Elusimicrobiota bacterium]
MKKINFIKYLKIIFIFLIIAINLYAKTHEKEFYDKKYALCIGINKYTGDIPELKYAVNDALEIKKELIKHGFITKLLINEQATKDNILKYFQDIKYLANKNDLILIYFAGHGTTNTEKDYHEKGYLIPYDCVKGTDTDKFIPMEIFSEIAKLRKNKQILFLIDSCFSGYGFTRKAVSFDKGIDYAYKLASLDSAQLIAAGLKNETAEEKNGHGVFTYFLLKALSGDCDADKDKIITASDIGIYSRKCVTEETKMQQTPQFGWLSGNGDIVFDLTERTKIFTSENFDKLIESKEEIVFTEDKIMQECEKADIFEKQGKFIEVEEILINLTKRIKKEDIKVIAEIYSRLSENASDMGYYDLGIYYGQIALNAQVKLSGWNSQDTANIINAIAMNSEGKGDYDRALEHYIKALDITRKQEKIRLDDVASLYNNIGNIYQQKGQYDLAIKYYNESLTIKKKYFKNDYLDLSNSYNNFATVYDQKGNYDRALKFAFKALNIRKKHLPKNHQKLSGILDNIGNIYKNKGEYDMAIEYYNKSLKIKSDYFGREHPNLISIYNNLANVYENKGVYDKAIEFYNKSMDIIRENYPDINLPTTARIYNNLGIVYADKRNYEEALKYYNKSLEIKMNYLESNHPDIISSYINIGNAYKGLSKYDLAMDWYNKASDVIFSILDKKHPLVAKLYSNIGQNFHLTGNLVESLKYYNLALEIYLNSLGRMHPEVAALYDNLGTLYSNMGDKNESCKNFKKAYEINVQLFGKEDEKSLKLKEKINYLKKK